MLIVELLNEDLGNLAQLNAGPLINILKQTGGLTRHRRGGDGIYTGKIEKKFQGKYGPATEVGSTSEVTDFIPLKDGFKTLRLAIKRATDADNDPKVFAIYIDQKAVALGAFDYDTLRGGSKVGRLAYDFSPFAAEIEKADDEEHDKKSEWQRRYPREPSKITSYHEKIPHVYSYSMNDKEREAAEAKAKANPDRFQGSATSTDEFVRIFNKIEQIATMVGGKISAKLVYIDKVAQGKRRARNANPPLASITKDFAADLKKRLAMYKNSKKPTVDTIEQFVEMSLKNPGKTVQFAGSTYSLKASSYDKLDPIALLRGTPFKTNYSSVDPGNYNSLYITYSFDKDTNQLLPIKAEWTDKSNEYTPASREAVLDAKGYLRAELNIAKLDKATVIKAVLDKFKGGQYKKVLTIIDALKKFGADWPELETIIKSVNVELAAKKKGA